MVVILSVLLTGRALLPRNIFCFWYSFLLEAEQIPGPSAAGRIRQIKKIHYLYLIVMLGSLEHAVAQLLEALGCKPEGCRPVLQWVYFDFLIYLILPAS
jgi:hypothetical protein